MQSVRFITCLHLQCEKLLLWRFNNAIPSQADVGGTVTSFSFISMSPLLMLSPLFPLTVWREAESIASIR